MECAEGNGPDGKQIRGCMNGVKSQFTLSHMATVLGEAAEKLLIGVGNNGEMAEKHLLTLERNVGVNWYMTCCGIKHKHLN